MDKDVLRVILFRGVEGEGGVVCAECMLLSAGLTLLICNSD